MTKTLLALSFLLLATPVLAGESFKSPDALEKELNGCLLKNQTNCIETILGKRILPGNDQMASIAKQLDELLVKWLDKETIYAIHPVRTSKTGEIYQKRTYLIEDTSGALMVFNVSTLKRLGEWYVFQFNLNSNSDAVTSTLKGELPQ